MYPIVYFMGRSELLRKYFGRPQTSELSDKATSIIVNNHLVEFAYPSAGNAASRPQALLLGTFQVMFGLKTIARKLPLALVGSAAIVSLGVGLGGYLIGSQMVGNMTEHNLSSLAYERAKQVDNLVASITGDLETTANSMAANQALRDFGNAWLQLQG